MDCFTDERPTATDHINPPPRRRAGTGRPTPPASPQLAQAAAGGSGHRLPPPPNAGAAAPEDDPPEEYKVGYKKPPLETRFKKNNLGGPGRPPGKKGQDTLFREALLKKRSLRIGNRNRQITNLELLNTLAIDVPVKSREHRHIMAVLADARRLFPEPAPVAQAPKTYDPEDDRIILQQMMALVNMGEPSQVGGDPLRDALLGSPNLGERAPEDGWDEGDWDISRGETANDEA